MISSHDKNDEYQFVIETKFKNGRMQDGGVVAAPPWG
jgi:hypothetical protein